MAEQQFGDMRGSKLIGVYPGSFDPVTNGHLDIIDRASCVCDTLYIAVLKNSAKQCLFSADERIKMIESCIKNNNIKIISFDGLVSDLVKELRADAIIKGVRTAADFEYESLQASVNSKMCAETLILLSKTEFIHVNSTVVKELARLKADLSFYLPENIIEKIKAKF